MACEGVFCERVLTVDRSIAVQTMTSLTGVNVIQYFQSELLFAEVMRDRVLSLLF